MYTIIVIVLYVHVYLVTYMFMCIISMFVITCLLYQGFKSRSLIVQLAVLIDDFALDLVSTCTCIVLLMYM